MNRNLKEQLAKRKIKRPNKLVSAAFFAWIGSACRKAKVQFSYDFDKKDFAKGPVILLCAHAARLEFKWSIYGFGRRDLNIVCGFQNMFKRYNYGAMKQMGVISKYLYQPDFVCTRQMLSVIKSGGGLVLYPEGIQSASGSAHPINPATARFLKKAGVPVVLCKSYGSYLATNRYCKDVKKGKISVNYSVLFGADELASLTEQQIYDKMIANFRYNDFESNKTIRSAYVGKLPNITGLDNIIYKCPKCNGEHNFVVQGGAMRCHACDYTVTMNEYYDLASPQGLVLADVDKWYKWQRKVLRQQVQQQGFCMQATGSLFTLRTDCLPKPPKNRILLCKGDVALNCDGLTITAANGESKFFAIKNLYSLGLVVGKYLEFYYGDDYYILVLDVAATHLAKWMIASEELHNLVDDKWFQASKDVYDYDL